MTLPVGLVVGTMCHCDDPDDDHWEFFYDVDGYDEETGHLRSGRQMTEAQMRAVAALVNRQASLPTMDQAREIMGVCKGCIQARFEASLMQVMLDDEPRPCAICLELRQPLYVFWVQKDE